jgi:UV DNA damage repair endonuclease
LEYNKKNFEKTRKYREEYRKICSEKNKEKIKKLTKKNMKKTKIIIIYVIKNVLKLKKDLL